MQSAYCDEVSSQLQRKLNAIHNMTANFSQVVKAKRRTISHSFGTMALQRPGHFRWDTKQPMEQLVVADGRRLWVYDKDLEQVTVKKQEQGLGGTAGLFLSGYNDTVARDFNVTVAHNGKKDRFDLHAKEQKANFQRVILIFQGDMIIGMELFDQLGQQTSVTLTQEKINQQLPPSLFTFKVPRGVDVVDQ